MTAVLRMLYGVHVEVDEYAAEGGVREQGAAGGEEGAAHA